MTLSALESMFGKVEAPSPQAVTVEGLMDVVEKWYSDSPLMPMPHSTQYDDLRTRLDQYLNNR